MRINPENFFDQIGATTEHRLNLKKPMAGYIDWDFDPSNYPNEWPRVVLDGQGLSARTYPCLSSYIPMPGDRVLLEPFGSGHVIMGAVLDNPTPRLLPGTLVFRAHSTLAQDVPSGTDVPVIWDVVELDLLGGWVGDTGFAGGDFRTQYTPSIPGWYRLTGAIGWTTNNSGWRTAWWRVNGGDTPFPGSTARTPSATTNAAIVTNARTVHLEFNGSSDYIELVGAHNVGTTISLNGSSNWYPSIDVTYAGPGNLNELLPSVE